MLKANWLLNIQQYLVCILAFLIPFPFICASVGIITLSAVWLLRFSPKQTWALLKERRILWLWLFFYALHVISYFYSEHKDHSLFDIQLKLSFVIMPLIIGAGMVISRQFLERIMLFFVSGITAVACFCIGRALIFWQKTADTTSFFYHDLVKGFDANAVYMALYTLFSISILLLFPWKNILNAKWKMLKTTLITMQVIFFILLSSRLLIVIFFLVIIPVYLVRKFKNSHFSKLQVAATILVFSLLFIALIVTDNPVRDRYESVIVQNDVGQAFLDDYSNTDESKFSNLTVRLFIWRMGILNIIDNKLWIAGSGNGDIGAMQNAKMAEYGLQRLDEEFPENRSGFYNVNMHNMFLQSLFMLGIIGFLTFMLITFLPFLKLRRFKYGQVFLPFHVSCIFFMFQEAALQTQAGIVYYCFFSIVFWNMVYGLQDTSYQLVTQTPKKIFPISKV